jgi:hypothetical protein
MKVSESRKSKMEKKENMERDLVEKELSQLLERTLHLEDELNLIESE